jgi:hypothetical protein
MGISKELNKLTESDVYSLMLFALYKMNESNEYSSLSQLSYILDKDNLLKLCEYYGGTTIRIPTIAELELMLNGLLVYQLIDIEGKDEETVIDSMRNKYGSVSEIQKRYAIVKEMLDNYNFNSGRC